MRTSTVDEFLEYAGEAVGRLCLGLAEHTVVNEQNLCSCGRLLPCQVGGELRRQIAHYRDRITEMTPPSSPLVRPFVPAPASITEGRR